MDAGDGPITVGYAHGDYTVTEIKECIEAQGSINPSDKIANERANRLVRIVGAITPSRTTLNDGKPIKTRLNWLVNPSTNVDIFAYNDNQNGMTTGSVMHYTGSMWVKDSA